MINIRPAVEYLDSIEWFCNAGRETHSFAFATGSCRSWQEAIVLRSSIESLDSFVEVRNRLTRLLSFHHRVEYRKWNDVAVVARSATDELFNLRIAKRVMPYFSRLQISGSIIEDSVKWDLSNYLMEYAFSDVVDTGIYTNLCEIYKHGHFPCMVRETNGVDLIILY